MMVVTVLRSLELWEACGVNSGAKEDGLCPSIQALEGEFGQVIKKKPGSPRAEAQQPGGFKAVPFLWVEVRGDLCGQNLGLSVS